MDYGLAFKYVFNDRKSVQKLLLGGLIALVPILNFVIGGYLLQVIRNIRDKMDFPLPEWGEEFGSKWVKGLLLYLILLIYMIPLIIILAIPMMMLIPVVIAAISTRVMGGVAPSTLPEAITAILANTFGAMGIFYVFIFFIFFLISAIYMLAFYYFINSVITRFAITGDFKEAFKLKELVDYIKKDPKSYTLTWLVLIGTFFGVSIVSSIVNSVVGVIGAIPFVGWCLSILLVPASLYAMGILLYYAVCVQGNLLGQLCNKNISI